MSDKKPQSEQETNSKSSKMVAIRDFECQFDDVKVRIAKGDNVSKMDLPKWVIDNLKTEKVLKG